jgi:general secretion pathway protein K
VAVITALLLTTLALTLVATLFWQQQVQVRSIENQRLQLQKQWVLRAALDWAALIVREDAKHSNVDHLGEPWAVSLQETRLDQYVDNGHTDGDASDATLSGNIIDAQSHYNLSNLSVNGSINAREVGIFTRLLTNLELDPTLAQRIAETIANTQKKPVSTDNAPAPAKTAISSSQPMPLTYIDDLFAVPGMSPEIVARLKEFVIVLPRPTPVNANTAPVEVLAASIDTLSLADAAVLINSREHAYFRDNADFAQRFQGKPIFLGGNEVSFGTNYFLVNGVVHLNRASLSVQALIERNGTRTNILWIREN